MVQDPTSVFIFVTSGYLAMSPASQVLLVNGALAENGMCNRVLMSLRLKCTVSYTCDSCISLSSLF